MKLLLSPHNDDECLFAAYTLMREKPLVIVVTDSDDETAAVVIVSGFVPKTAVAPAGSPIALSVSVQELLFPLCEIDTAP